MTCAIASLFSVSGKVVVITGGGTGIGRMLAEGLVENGSQVIIIGRRGDVLNKTAREINEEYGGKAGHVISMQGDVSTKIGVEQLREQIGSRYDKVDVLINNAAIQKPWSATIADHRDPDDIEQFIWEGSTEYARDAHKVKHEGLMVVRTGKKPIKVINVNGPFFLTAGLVPLLKRSSDPSVIVIGSIAAIANQRPVSTITYGVSKAAGMPNLRWMSCAHTTALHLASMLAGRLAPLRIRVNTILPGTFPTDITSKPSPTPSDPNARTLFPAAAKVALRTPLGRVGRKEEIVGPCLMLASSAGSYMTNAVISVDGGRNMVNGTKSLAESLYTDPHGLCEI